MNWNMPEMNFPKSNVKHLDALVLDANHNNRAETSFGQFGIDFDKNGVKDGSAIKQDLMPAMSDFNGNDEVDGEEVFGTMTKSPITGQDYDSANGFEAMKKTAMEVENTLGLTAGTIYNPATGLVNLEELSKDLPLATGNKVQFGYLTGDENKNLNPFNSDDAAFIKVDYAKQDNKGVYFDKDNTMGHLVEDKRFPPQIDNSIVLNG